MPSNVLFAPMAYTRYEASQTLPEKFTWLKERIVWLIDWINENDIMAAVVGLLLLLTGVM